MAVDALHMQEWCVREENDEHVKGFTSELQGLTSELLDSLQGALVFPRGRRPLNREMWQQFFTVRSSSGFISR